MWWAAMLVTESGPPPDAALRDAVATWALQYSPRVTAVDEAIAVELSGSERLFGGRDALCTRLQTQAAELGVVRIGWGSTRLAALALARAGVCEAADADLTSVLDRLPCSVLGATLAHRDTLAQLGCHTLGELRKLPRGGISRRFGASVLEALDHAYGLRTEACTWVVPAERFATRLELPSRVEHAAGLLFGARRLALQLAGWLAGRQAGVLAITLRWDHDTMRARHVGACGALTVRTAAPTRDVDHLCRLLAEHLAHEQLAAPVGDLSLTADEVQPLAPAAASLLPETAPSGEGLRLVLERLAARLGPQAVLRPVPREDHRPEHMQRWQSADEALPRDISRRVPHLQPTFLLPAPMPLAVRGGRPVYQGPLMLLAGPHRVEGGWWHREPAGADAVASAVDLPDEARHVERDYWIASSAQAGLLWIFQERLAATAADGRAAAGAWFLHGTFA